MTTLNQANEKLQRTQGELDSARKEQLVSSTGLHLERQAKAEAEAQLRTAQEARNSAVTQLATEGAVWQEKRRAAEATVSRLEVRRVQRRARDMSTPRRTTPRCSSLKPLRVPGLSASLPVSHQPTNRLTWRA